MSSDRSRRTLVLVAAASLLSMSPWFSATVVLPQLEKLWQADIGLAAWLTMAVQLGFVVGGLVSALFNLPDRFSAPRLFAVSSLLAAAANAGFAGVAADNIPAALAMRFLTGAFLAGVYPPGMKILAGWFHDGRGTALGVLVGALTIGKALPYSVAAAGDLPWRIIVLWCSAGAVLGAVLVALGVKEGPYAAPQPPLDLHQIGAVFRNRGARLANFGYFGHMWELYSMWGWIALLLGASAGAPGPQVALAAFLAIAAGAVGCIWAGWAADAGQASPEVRVARRARVTIVAMAVSGACCLLAAAFFEHFWLLVVICLVWGAAVVADSAQFSTIVSEVSDRRYVGTALTVQTAIGFLLTVVSLRVVGAIGANYGWNWAAASMAIGPALGIAAMWRLRRPIE
ncbi:MAG TPA: MFS transporter [Candidatus Acidoferrales bacterium]|nr:MFS transporter [Candidatus Acidoferrales bacterium]